MKDRVPNHNRGHSGHEKLDEYRIMGIRRAERDERIEAEARRLYALPDDMRWGAIRQGRLDAASRDANRARDGELIVGAAVWLYHPNR